MVSFIQGFKASVTLSRHKQEERKKDYVWCGVGNLSILAGPSCLEGGNGHKGELGRILTGEVTYKTLQKES